jgi:hypothetical protein
MRFVCQVCNSEAVHNEKLAIHYCEDHGMITEPDLPVKRLDIPENGLFVRQKMTK